MRLVGKGGGRVRWVTSSCRRWWGDDLCAGQLAALDGDLARIEEAADAVTVTAPLRQPHQPPAATGGLRRLLRPPAWRRTARPRRGIRAGSSDRAFDYHDGPVLDRLREAAPDGIDVCFDNAGGEQLRAAIEVMNVHGRIARCGGLSRQSTARPDEGPVIC